MRLELEFVLEMNCFGVGHGFSRAVQRLGRRWALAPEGRTRAKGYEYEM